VSSLHKKLAFNRLDLGCQKYSFLLVDRTKLMALFSKADLLCFSLSLCLSLSLSLSLSVHSNHKSD